MKEPMNQENTPEIREKLLERILSVLSPDQVFQLADKLENLYHIGNGEVIIVVKMSRPFYLDLRMSEKFQ